MRSIETITQWKNILKNSENQLTVVYKHSNACGVSVDAREHMIEFEKSHPEIPVYEVVVQTARDVSDAIEKNLDIVHESPQVIVLKNGIYTYHTSHYDIQVSTLAGHIASLRDEK